MAQTIPNNMVYGNIYSKAIYDFKVVLNNGAILNFSSAFYYDYTKDAEYIKNKKKKIYPNDTEYVRCLSDYYTYIKGNPNGKFWLFPVEKGMITALCKRPQHTDKELVYIQKNENEELPFTEVAFLQMISDQPKAIKKFKTIRTLKTIGPLITILSIVTGTITVFHGFSEQALQESDGPPVVALIPLATLIAGAGMWGYSKKGYIEIIHYYNKLSSQSS